MATDDQPDSRTPADGTATQNPAPAPGGLRKAGIAAAVVAGLALIFMGGWWFGMKRNAPSSDGDSSNERDSREKGGSVEFKAGDTKMFMLPGGVEMEMVYVAPGSFMMGSPESEAGRGEDEASHYVTLTKGFWLGKYPVTQRQWKELVRANGVSFPEGEPVPYFSRDGKGRDRVSGLDTSDFPMENISWYDCKSLVDALNKNERGEWHWSFPTEAQWEFAARGGTKSRGYTYSGGNDLDAFGWYYENSGLRRLSDSDHIYGVDGEDEILSSNKCRTHSVKEKDVGNELGIVGMSGNVRERCADQYGEYPRDSVVDPIGPASRWDRVLRGGGWDDGVRDCRSASRHSGWESRSNNCGFRLCCSAGPHGEAESGVPTRSGRRPARVGSHGKVQLWESGPHWAETNIGAEEPWEYGYYFWWGDTVGYERKNYAWVASDGSSRNFSFDEKNTPTFGKDTDKLKSEGWITETGVLAPKHDAAHVHWGGNWRMPTEQELEDLNKKCVWTWATKNGIEGYVVRGRGEYASASIFLPAAGGVVGDSLRYTGTGGFYLSSSPYLGGNDARSLGPKCALSLGFCLEYHETSCYKRDGGQSVRPVQGFTKQRTK